MSLKRFAMAGLAVLGITLAVPAAAVAKQPSGPTGSGAAVVTQATVPYQGVVTISSSGLQSNHQFFYQIYYAPQGPSPMWIAAFQFGTSSGGTGATMHVELVGPSDSYYGPAEVVVARQANGGSPICATTFTIQAPSTS